MNPSQKTLLGISFAVLAAIVVSVLTWTQFVKYEKFADCTMVAKLCPDGSYVGRNGPRCEFAPCPSVISDIPLKIFSDKNIGVTFEYPENLDTKYIDAVDWPPQVQVTDGPFSCSNAGAVNAPAGMSETRVIGTRTYCATKESQGAAGSVYNQYAYATQKYGKIVILTFSLRYPQCVNYEQPNQNACKSEEESFNVDSLVDQIMDSLSLRTQLPV